jgi:tRNA-dihydrouridine synthase
MQRATGCAAVMIGRGALGAPWVFGGPTEPDSAYVRPPTSRTGPDDPATAHRARIIRRHCALIQEHLPERTALLQLKKHLAWYSSGRPHAARLRPALFQTPSAAAVLEVFWGSW